MSSNDYVRYYGTYQGKLSIDYEELITYLVDPFLSNDLSQEFYNKTDIFLGSGGGINNITENATGGGAIVLKSVAYNL